MKHRITLIAAAAALLLAAACSTQKQAPHAPATAATLTPEANAGAAQRFASMTAAYGMWNDVQMPVRASLRSPMSLSASGKITMVRDRLVHISMRLLGIELAVGSITPDSIHIYDKFHRYLVAESTAALTGGTGISFADIQSALLGRAFVPGHGPATAAMASGLSLSATGTSLEIAPAKAHAAYNWTMEASTLSDGRVALTAITVSAAGKTATCTYTPATKLTTAGAVASALNIKATIGSKKIDAGLTYTVDQAVWNTSPAISQPSTKGYKRLSATAFLKSGLTL